MRRLRLIVILAMVVALTDVFPRVAMCREERIFVSSSRLTLGTDADLSASVRIADIDHDNDLDVIVANGRHWPQQNFLLINQGDGKGYREVRFGDESHATYGLDTGDLNGDGFEDIVVANSGSQNLVFLNRSVKE